MKVFKDPLGYQVYYRTGLFSALRHGELCALKREDITIGDDEMVLHVRTEKQKNDVDKFRDVTIIDTETIELLKKYLETLPNDPEIIVFNFHHKDIYRAIVKAGRWANIQDYHGKHIKHITPHMLRKALATHLDRVEHANPLEIQATLGHQKFSSTEVYLDRKGITIDKSKLPSLSKKKKKFWGLVK